MTFFKLVLAGLRHHWRSHAGAFAGAALCAMVLVGSLLVGDSLRGTLRDQARARTGAVLSALVGGERMFRSALAGEIGSDVAPVLFLRGSSSRADGSARLNQVQVIGVDPRFWALAPRGERQELQPGDAVVSRALATRLGIGPGDSLIVRVEKPSAFSKDAPLSGEEDGIEALRARVATVADDADFGRFSLQAAQVPPATVFLPLEQLQQRLSVEGRVNLLLSNRPPAEFRESLARHWSPEDAALQTKALADRPAVEVRSSRVFLDDGLVKALPAGQSSLTYFVNELRNGDRATPYSMVTAVEPGSLPFVPPDLAADEMVISDWLAEDTGVRPGAELEVKYLVMNAKRQFEEKSRRFRVRSVHPLGKDGWDGSWMPDFPGLADAGNCREWKPGFALDTRRIRDKDEVYWKQHRGAPKAFVGMEAGRQMWANRWGSVTAIRYPVQSPAELEAKIRPGLGFEVSGMQLVPLRALASAAVDSPVDFAGLFLGFSFFLIAAALALGGLLFGLMVESRGAEAGTLLALGWPVSRVRLLFLGEGLGVALAGSLLGTALGVAYTRGILRALGGVWRGATGGTAIVFHLTRTSLGVGACAGTLIAALAMMWVTRNCWKRSARELLEGATPVETVSRGGRGLKVYAALAALFGCSGAGLLGMALARGQAGPELFFGGGSLLLVSLLMGCRRGLEWLAQGSVRAIRQLAWRNVGRRPGRAAAVVSVLAAGAFLVLSVQVFRKEPPSGPQQRSSGTGGFALIGELSTPVYEDLNAPAVRDGLGLPADKDVRVVPFRVREGEDASCLNLNRAVRPRILGAPSAELEHMGAFRLMERDSGWGVLRRQLPGAIPAVVDEDTLLWALQKRVGDEIPVPDGRGGEVRLKVVGSLGGSILQGALLVDEGEFVRAFPDAGGYRFLLLDAPGEQLELVRGAWSRALQDRGLELVPTARRLAELLAVSNTYLQIFQVLGGLGVLLGALGVGVIAARNAVERRAELAILEASGWSRAQRLRLLVWELALLVILGLLIGGTCAWVVTVPGQWIRGAFVDHRPLLAALAGLGVVAAAAIRMALALSLRGSAGRMLRSE
jgi:ABC-type lipoprotein release transport system permease subunit